MHNHLTMLYMIPHLQPSGQATWNTSIYLQDSDKLAVDAFHSDVAGLHSTCVLTLKTEA